MSKLNKLSLIHPDDMDVNFKYIINKNYDEEYILSNHDPDYISEDTLEISNETEDSDSLFNGIIMPPKPPSETIMMDKSTIKILTIGDGKFDFINESQTKIMLQNAYQAIELTKMWNFVAESIDSFTYSNDMRVKTIMKKMCELGYDGHSGSSFGYAMRNMQYLARNGEEKFKELFA